MTRKMTSRLAEAALAFGIGGLLVLMIAAGKGGAAPAASPVADAPAAEPFRQDPACPACLWREVKLLRFAEAREKDPLNPARPPGLLYACDRCGYLWRMLPANHGSKAEAEKADWPPPGVMAFDEHAICGACLHGKATWKFLCDPLNPDKPDMNCLFRICERCQYSWKMLPAFAKKPEKKE